MLYNKDFILEPPCPFQDNSIYQHEFYRYDAAGHLHLIQEAKGIMLKVLEYLYAGFIAHEAALLLCPNPCYMLRLPAGPSAADAVSETGPGPGSTQSGARPGGIPGAGGFIQQHQGRCLEKQYQLAEGKDCCRLGYLAWGGSRQWRRFPAAPGGE